MIFHENRLLADDSHEISYLFFKKLGKMSQNVSFAAVVMGALRIKIIFYLVKNTKKRLPSTFIRKLQPSMEQALVYYQT